MMAFCLLKVMRKLVHEDGTRTAHERGGCLRSSRTKGARAGSWATVAIATAFQVVYNTIITEPGLSLLHD
jgi:hypothetical protein